MDIRLLPSGEDLGRYDAWVRTHPHGNLWQSPERKQYLEAIGKEVKVYVAEENDLIIASALVMIDKTSFGLSTWDCARGPLGDGNLLDRIIADAKSEKCMSLYFSPPGSSLLTTHYPLVTSKRHIHAQATRILDLTVSDDQLLAQMKPKGRYNIGVAEKHGVTVSRSDDAEAFYALVRETSKRDGFTRLSLGRYRAFLTSQPGSFLLLAFDPSGHSQKAVAGLMGVIWNGTGLYYYGASSYEHRALMAPYLLQWEAMKLCKAAGCTNYDLLGIAPADAAADHPWQGITSFKEKFGGTYVEYPAEQEIVLRPFTKKALSIKRSILG